MIWRPTRTTILSRLAIVALLVAAPLAASDLSGHWNFTWNTEGGVRQSTLEFVQDGDKLSATMDKTQLEGEVKNGEFRLAGKLYSAEAGYSSQLEITGNREGEKLVGKGLWDVYPMTFTAVRAE